MHLLLVLALVAGQPPVRTEAIRAHMTFLASDLLEGRGTGTRGYRLAAEYVASQYEQYGLEPGANGSWFQEVPFRETVPDASSSVTLTRGSGEPVTLKNFIDFVTYGDPLVDDKVIEGDV